MSYRDELVRKGIHLSSTICPLFYLLTNKTLTLAIAVPVMLIFVAVDVLRRRHAGFRSLYNYWLGKLMRTDEHSQMCGASYVMIAVVICVFAYAKPVAVAALLFMSVSDALASLVGIRVGGRQLFGKTLAGSLTFLGSALVIALLCMPDQPLVGVLGAVTATCVEAAPLRLAGVRLDDNLFVPVTSGAVMTAACALL